MTKIIQFMISGILTFIFYRHYSKKISEDIPLFSSFILLNILKMTEINFITNNILWILYYIIFIICFKNIVLCFKGKATVLRVTFIAILFITITYIIILI